MVGWPLSRMTLNWPLWYASTTSPSISIFSSLLAMSSPPLVCWFRHCASHERARTHDRRRAVVDTVRYLNLGLRFVLELGALVARAWGGVHVGGWTGAELILGICLPLLAAVIWWLFVAPKARFSVPLRVRAP